MSDIPDHTAVHFEESELKITNDNGLVRIFFEDDEWFRNKDAATEIERLREDGKQIRRDWKTDLFNLRKRIKERDERIAELEKHYNEQVCLKCMHAPGHHITDAQINAAWNLLSLYQNRHSDVLELAMRIFNALGIVRCEGCEDHPRIWSSTSVVKCPDCNGRVRGGHD